jgi:hypothetical protein
MGRWAVLATLVLSGCAPFATQRLADAAFHKALTAQLSHQDEVAESYYKEIIVLGLGTSAVWNNLAAIEVHRRHIQAARHLLARAVEASDRDLVAITNYGVVSFWLSDFREAERALESAQLLRRDLLNGIPSMGNNDYVRDRFEKDTAQLARVADKYLDRISKSLQMQTGEPTISGELIADITPARL